MVSEKNGKKKNLREHNLRILSIYLSIYCINSVYVLCKDPFF